MLDKIRDFNIISKWRIWYVIPAAIVLIALMMFFIIGGSADNLAEGMNIGIDFTGGTIVTVSLGEGAEGDAYNDNVKKITDIIEANGAKVSQYQKSSASESADSSIDFRFKNPLEDGNQTDELNNKIKSEIAAAYNEDANDVNFIQISTIGITTSSKLMKDAILATAIAIALILIYICIRFELWSGLSAVIALIHDVVIMFAFIIIFRIQVNSSIVAAIVTIVSYSINNTIVIFDRVREKMAPIEDKSRVNFEFIGNEAIYNTMTRTLFTSATTMTMVILLAIFGVPSLREFTLPIIFGLVAGTYSSIFIATPTWALMNVARYGKKQKAKTTFKKK